ncbi:RsfA family transcriptional regulator [Salipaludibacillus sp. HK11]|uniref:RsfA family transcriptional regulator n=1 Tax=Salipaludibacillus sp. HK11 TaxID=3394320 RepID=UPI0039FD60B4
MIRQDAWNQDEDLLLAETVLRHIREGGTQLAAFDEVAERLSRTSAACGFRWNSSVRKKYQSAIQMAKKTRKEAKKQLVSQNHDQVVINSSGENIGQQDESDYTTEEEIMWFDQMISFLQRKKEKVIDVDESLVHSLVEIQDENKRLKEELSQVSEAYEDVREEYHVMIKALQRATNKEKLR